jgi:NAD(P)-dependent dehydrogenase (short-subunit alcohol dehydrogenase family)
MRLAHPHLRKHNGVIVNFGSGVQLDSSESFHGVYAAAKNAIEALTRVAAVEWGPDGIRTLLIMPAAESPQLQAFQARDPDRFAQMLGRIPLGRFGDAEHDIGRTIAWLVSDNARYMTGCTIMLDGGQMYMR